MGGQTSLKTSELEAMGVWTRTAIGAGRREQEEVLLTCWPWKSWVSDWTEHRKETEEGVEAVWIGRWSQGAFGREDGCEFVGIYLSLKFHWDFHLRCPVG